MEELYLCIEFEFLLILGREMESLCDVRNCCEKVANIFFSWPFSRSLLRS